MTSAPPLGLGLVGCGSFGLFCLDAFSQMADVRIAAVADANVAAAEKAARRFGAAAHAEPAELIRRDDVHLVHVATPPSSHHELAVASLRAGKHVLCEKPLAMDLRQADEILAAADDARRIAPVNFVLRYNEVVEAAHRILEAGVLGKVLAGRLTNCAFDTRMPPDHWFWDPGVSGGIFIEHGVHFFDLYTHWLGAGRVVDARTEHREGTAMEDRVLCTIRFDAGAIVTHYHGFDQIEPMDRADHRLICELGDLRVFGWIPLRLEVDAAVNDEGAERLAACCDGCTVETTDTYAGGPVLGRGRPRDVTRRIRLTYAPRTDKAAVYADSIRALLADQIACLRDAGHPRRVTESNGRAALELAEQAATLARAAAH